ncbi:hypothetical protein [Phenylobacterium sp.]|uniref:hypothetical protein n=1 Tax=Phenylobacterium sp. TaxID=1871053 RepID=UPI0035B15847
MPSLKNAPSYPIIIRPTPQPIPPPDLPVAVKEMAEAARAETTKSPVSERLTKPHPIIVRWLAEHDEKKRRARQERDPWMKKLIMPAEYTEQDRRQHRFFDALFKALERNGATIKQGDRNELIALMQGEQIQFQLREKHKQGRRALTADEKRWASPGAKDWKQELTPTGKLLFEVKTYLPEGMKSQWLETDDLRIEDMLPEIVAAFVAATPMLVERRCAREEAERARVIAEQQRYEAQQRRKRDANRWRRFNELAQDWKDLAQARDFLNFLKSLPADSDVEIDGRTIADWLEWADDWLRRADPLAEGLTGIFQSVSSVNEWDYRN